MQATEKKEKGKTVGRYENMKEKNIVWITDVFPWATQYQIRLTLSAPPRLSVCKFSLYYSHKIRFWYWNGK